MRSDRPFTERAHKRGVVSCTGDPFCVSASGRSQCLLLVLFSLRACVRGAEHPKRPNETPAFCEGCRSHRAIPDWRSPGLYRGACLTISPKTRVFWSLFCHRRATLAAKVHTFKVAFGKRVVLVQKVLSKPIANKKASNPILHHELKIFFA